MAFLVAALACGEARAGGKEQAREHFRQGTLRYDLGEIRPALEAFKRAYLEYQDPAFLFNIAQCDRQLGNRAEALRGYKVYLRKVPRSSNREQVEHLIVDLQAALDSEAKAAERPPQGTIEPERAVVVAPAPVAAEPIVTTAPPSAGDRSAELTASAPPRKHKRALIWGLVAGGVVLAGGAVTLGILLSRNHDTELNY